MSKVIPGGYEFAPMQGCSMPEQVATGFGQVTETLVGATYVPVLYVGKQVVCGINHMIICKQTLAAQDAPEHLVKMVLNQASDGDSITGNWSLIGIEKIV